MLEIDLNLSFAQSPLAESLNQFFQTHEQPLYAAFDADGTLWSGDLGESFFRYQIENHLVSLPDEPWEHYYQLKENGRQREAYLWLAQINRGAPLSQVQKWAHDHFQNCLTDSRSFSFMTFQKDLISYLLKHKVVIFIVTASIRWAIEPAARALQLSSKNVLGIKTKVLNNEVSDIQDGELTWKEGKTRAFLQATHGHKPFLCAGNTLGDRDLLAIATHYPIAVCGHLPKDSEYAHEMELQEVAKTNGWWRLRARS